MYLDPFTLLLARLGLDVVYTLVYLSLAVLRPGLAGPRWWWRAALMAGLSTLTLVLGLGGSGLWPALLFGPLLSAGIMLAWLGTRAFLGLTLPVRAMYGLWPLLMVTNGVLVLWVDAEVAPRALLWLVVLVFAWLTQRNVKEATQGVKHYELLTSGWLARFELVIALSVLASVLWWPSVSDVQANRVFNELLFGLITFAVVFRGVVYAFLMALRMQQIKEAAEFKLSESEEELRTLIENINAGVIVVRPDQTVLTVNAAARHFLDWPNTQGHDAGDVWSSRDWRLLREDGTPMPPEEAPVEQVLATGRSVSDVLLGVHTDALAPVRWALCNAFAQFNAIGELRHVVFTLVDITARRNAQAQKEQLEHQLAQSQKLEALGTLAGGVAHDFNNILASILGNAELLRQDLGDEVREHDSLREIGVAARRGRELVRQVLAFSRRQPKVLTEVNVGEVLAESCRLLRTAMPSRVELVQQVASPSATVMADATQMGQIFVNLGSNALNAMADRSGRIEFRVERLLGSDFRVPEVFKGASPAGVVCISVRDEGCGMEASVQERIFEPFFTTQMTQQSTGLGLPVVLGIVQSHGGVIEVHSEVGVGTTFTLFFPAVKPSACRKAPESAGRHESPAASELPAVAMATTHTTASPATGEPTNAPTNPSASAPASTTAHGTPGIEQQGAADAPSAPPEVARPAQERPTPGSSASSGVGAATSAVGDGQSVLYLDDDESLVLLVRRLLERKGFRVSAFTDQQSAIEAVREQPLGYAVFMTDFNMPGMSGLDVAHAVLAINPELTVALASGYITEDLQQQASAMGVREVVFKTDAVEAFCDVVARLARR
jgi:two-component system, cell cycle sensor histidine kinase and response regulator CckA